MEYPFQLKKTYLSIFKTLFFNTLKPIVLIKLLFMYIKKIAYSSRFSAAALGSKVGFADARHPPCFKITLAQDYADGVEFEFDDLTVS